MKQSNVVLAFVTLCSVLVQDCTGYSTNDHHIDIPTYTECGGVIPLTWNPEGAAARVSYKNGTLFNPLEFCVWTFISKDAAGEVTLKFTESIEDRRDGIVVYTWEDSNLTTYKIPHGNSDLLIDTQHFAVAFSSDDSHQSHGFYFDVIVEKAGDGGKNTEAYFPEHNMSKFTYPKDIGHDCYDDNQRVSVVVQGPDATKFREYLLRDLDTEANSDFVDVYMLWEYQFTSHYQLVGR